MLNFVTSTDAEVHSYFSQHHVSLDTVDVPKNRAYLTQGDIAFGGRYLVVTLVQLELVRSCTKVLENHVNVIKSEGNLFNLLMKA